MKKSGSLRSGPNRLKTTFIVLAAVCAILCLCIVFFGGRPSAEPVASNSDVPFIITELLPDNESGLKDDAGNFSDWVEIYNASDKSASLEGYYLSDNETQPLRWEFPPITVKARDYIVVFCSGEDRFDSEKGCCHTNFRLGSSGETVVLSKPSAVYSSSVKYGEAVPDISFGLILTEETGSLEYKWIDNPTPGGANSGNYSDNAYLMPSLDKTGVVINEYQSHNTCTLYDSDGDYCDWVELYNGGDEAADMSGCVLTDDETRSSRWRFPEGSSIPAHGYLTVFLSGKDSSENGELHASFGIGTDDGRLVLFDRAARMIDTVEIVPLADDISYGRGEDDNWYYYALPTPGRENNTRAFGSIAATATVADRVYISEVCAAVARTGSGGSPDWIEIRNGTSEPVDLEGYGLGKSVDALRAFVFGSKVLAPGEYAVVSAAGDGVASKGQAPFKISSSGNTLYLTDPDGRVVDKFDSGKLSVGMSSGRVPDTDSSARAFFTTVTPGADNPSEHYTGYAPKPEILADGGYVKSGTKVRISVPEGTVVRYTTDGSVPNSGSAQYSGEITVDSSMTITAAAFADGRLRSDCDFATFLTGERSTLPVVCLSGNAAGLFSDKAIRLGGEPLTDMFFNGSDDGAERPLNIEYFDGGKRALEFTAGVRVYGDGTRVFSKRSLAIMLRDIYGKSSVTYPFFKDCERVTAKSLSLRAGGQDGQYAFLRDSYCARVALKYSDNLVASASQPVALYINGRYWGLYEIREKLNEDFMELNCGVPKQNIDIIRGNYIVDTGSAGSYHELVSFMSGSNMNDKEIYDTVCEKIDIDSAIDYLIFEHFFMNNDRGNIRVYHDRVNGKWRWIFYDMDLSMREHFGGAYMDGMYKRFDADDMIKYLLRSDAFRKRFLKRYGELLDTAFKPEELISVFEDLEKEIEPEVERSYKRWRIMRKDNWQNQMDSIKKNLKTRPDYVRAELKAYFNLSSEEYNSYFK